MKNIKITRNLAKGGQALFKERDLPEDGQYNVVVCQEGGSVKPRETVLFDVQIPFAPDTYVYGEGVSMLSQYEGTVEEIRCIGSLDDRFHYGTWNDWEWNQVYNIALFREKTGMYTLIGFSSCRRYHGCIRFNNERLKIVLNLEEKEISDREEIVLEELFIRRGEDRDILMKEFADAIVNNHPVPALKQYPTGWCSWYCFGPEVTEERIFNQLDKIRQENLALTYIQVDDGYQAHMGDWLTASDDFPHGIKSFFARIKKKGFEPAIWVAPFIAEKDSEILRLHPEWFIQNEKDEPLNSSEVTFGGWRCAPWYFLDPTHPGAYEYLKNVFRTMRKEWDCRYFKLDANMWGCMEFGKRYDDSATSVEAYRLGMKAIREGAGDDSILLGCNAPMWPSVGTVHANRVTGDVCRKRDVFLKIAKEGFCRNWQNGILWINDPDCVTIEETAIQLADAAGHITGQGEVLANEEFLFHASYIYASGGMVLSGDDFTLPHLQRVDVLRYLLKGPHRAAWFDSEDFRIGHIPIETGKVLCLFNWKESEESIRVQMEQEYMFYDVWEKRNFGQGRILEIAMPPVCGKLIECKDINLNMRNIKTDAEICNVCEEG